MIFKQVGHRCPILALLRMWYLDHVENTNNPQKTICKIWTVYWEFFESSSDTIKVTDEEQTAKSFGFFLIAKENKNNWNEALIPFTQLIYKEAEL